MSRRSPAPENKAADGPVSLEETNAAADKAQQESAKLAARGKPATEEELGKSGYRLPSGFLDQEDPNAGHESTEQQAGDGGANSPAKE